MAKLYITEYSNPCIPGGSNVSVVAEPMVTDQTPVAISSSSAASSAFSGATQLVRLHTDAICSVVFGTAPTATANNRRMPANATEYFQVPLGGAYKVAVITNS